MPTDVVMPQMGESIFEGTITKWLKKAGEKVQRDDPLFDISTDKVDAEIPAPASGVLQEIKVSEGTTVGVNTVVGTITVDGEAAATAKPAPATSIPEKSAPEKPAPEKKPEVKEEKKPTPAPTVSVPPAQESAEDEETRSSPLVRKIAREHGVSLSQISGTGLGGRITKQDIMAFIERPASASAAPASQTPAAAAPSRPATAPTQAAY